MWDDFWRVVFFIMIVAVLTTCVSCAGGGKEKPMALTPERLETLIKAARKAGCIVKGINIDAYMETAQIVCQNAK